MTTEKQESGEKCPRCKGSVVNADAEVVCTRCGMVVRDKEVSLGYDDAYDKSNSRTGPPTTKLFQESTIIDRVNKDSSGNNLSSEMRTTMTRLRTWNSRTQNNTSTARNYHKAFTDLNKLCDKMSIPKPIKERSAEIYKEAIDRKLIRGRTITVMIASCLYAAIRETLTPRTLNDVAENSNTNKKDISANYRLVVNELNMVMPTPDSVAYIPRIASMIDPPATEQVKRYAIKLLNEAKKKLVSQGKDPIGFAASALYVSNVVLGYSTTQRAISVAANITEVTIRNRYKDLLKFVKEDDIKDVRKNPHEKKEESK